MNRALALAALALFAVFGAGCASTYSSIHKVDDNNYYLTRIKGAKSTLYACSPIGQSADLRCIEISTPD
ncbi:MAG: hypothetical protein JST00_10750 [Deltaproteobacteria bacterium]|nr:hypothetical protein [Deltaproteobacteria bacterium]